MCIDDNEPRSLGSLCPFDFDASGSGTVIPRKIHILPNPKVQIQSPPLSSRDLLFYHQKLQVTLQSLPTSPPNYQISESWDLLIGVLRVFLPIFNKVAGSFPVNFRLVIKGLGKIIQIANKIA
jgi:hypothetical protein